MEIQKDNIKEGEEIKEQVIVPELVGLSIKEAEKITKEIGLEISIEGEIEGKDKHNTIIKEQIPIEGVKVNKGNRIIISF